MTDRHGSPPDFLHPDFEPGEFDRIERQLRRALAEEARQVRPADRLDAILHEANQAGPVTATGGTGRRRWLLPVAAAAAVAAIAGGLLWSDQDDQGTPGPPANTGPTTVAHTPGPSTAPTTARPSTSASSGTAGPTSSTGSTTGTGGPSQTTQATLPAYFVGPIGDDKPTYKLFREFLRGPVTVPVTDAAKAKAALALAMNAQPYSNTDGYLQPWSGTRVTAVDVTPARITVTLSNGGPDGFDAQTQRLAVQELVWTAQAAVGKGTIPVRFSVPGASTLFGTLPTNQDYNRPGKDELWKDLAPIWVTTPARDQVLPASKPVVVTGQAIVFEASLSWQLSQGTTAVKQGHTMASIGAPSQGSYSIDLGRLPAGDYSIKVFQMSMQDGDKVAAQKVVSFSVR